MSVQEEMLQAIIDGDPITDECMCRREEFLKAIANGEGSANLPEPMCREEVLLKVIAENGIGSSDSLPTQSKTVDPTTAQQTVTADSGYRLSSVKVNAVTSAIDSNITADNIKKDVTILGVTGNMEQGEDLTTELEAQDTAITELESAVDNLAEPKQNAFQAMIDQVNSLNYLMYNYTGNNVDFLEGLDTSRCTKAGLAFRANSNITSVPFFDLSNVVEAYNMFEGCTNLKTVPLYDFSKNTTFRYMFEDCAALESIPPFDMSSNTSLQGTFSGCESLTEIPVLETKKVTSFNVTFSNCKNLVTIPYIDMINASNVSQMFVYCTSLVNLTLKNVKMSLQIGGGTVYSDVLSLDSLVNTIKELWDWTDSTSTHTLTIGTVNLEKLASTYVKLITPTDEQIAADEYLTSKMPCEVCESTDEGAMLITDYALLKNWTIA